MLTLVLRINGRQHEKEKPEPKTAKYVENTNTFEAYSRQQQRAEKKKKAHMSKLLTSLVFLAFVFAAGGFAVLAVWDVPVAQTTVEKTLDSSTFLNRNI